MWGKRRDIQILQHGPRVDGHELKCVSVSTFFPLAYREGYLTALMIAVASVWRRVSEEDGFFWKLFAGGDLIRLARSANHKAGGARLNKFHINLIGFGKDLRVVLLKQTPGTIMALGIFMNHLSSFNTRHRKYLTLNRIAAAGLSRQRHF